MRMYRLLIIEDGEIKSDTRYAHEKERLIALVAYAEKIPYLIRPLTEALDKITAATTVNHTPSIEDCVDAIQDVCAELNIDVYLNDEDPSITDEVPAITPTVRDWITAVAEVRPATTDRPMSAQLWTTLTQYGNDDPDFIEHYPTREMRLEDLRQRTDIDESFANIETEEAAHLSYLNDVFFNGPAHVSLFVAQRHASNDGTYFTEMD